MTNNERKSEYDRCAGNDGMHEDSLVEGMKELMPVYCVIGKISVDISHILGNLITVIFDYQILRKPLKILSL